MRGLIIFFALTLSTISSPVFAQEVNMRQEVLEALETAPIEGCGGWGSVSRLRVLDPKRKGINNLRLYFRDGESATFYLWQDAMPAVSDPFDLIDGVSGDVLVPRSPDGTSGPAGSASTREATR